MASCTAVSVRLRGRFCVCDVRDRLERLGRGRMRREAMIKTWRSENFFSSSRVRLRFDCFSMQALVILVDRRLRSAELRRLRTGKNLPLLHPMEALKGWDGDKDDNR